MMCSGILKYVVLTFFLLVTCVMFSQDKRVRTIVIDPGHGGRQGGTYGTGNEPIEKRTQEKNVNLAVSLKLGALIEEWFPDVKVLYTRKDDSFVDFYDRSGLANDNNADLFISIHANADGGRDPASTGYETYIMGLHKTKENLELAMFENSFMLDEEDYETKYEGFDPLNPESYIMFNLIQKVYMKQSLKMAEYIQEEFQNGPIKRDRGVKQAGYFVLYMTATPSVLIELGFLSNPEEEHILNSPDRQQEMAECIFRAFKRYKTDTDALAEGM